jgi:serine/threonine-protein kinase
MSLIGKNIGNYQIKAKLGEGGMGAVYLGEHPLIGKKVAVKVLLDELASKEDIVQRFFNEAKAVNDIGHQNIVDIVDFGKFRVEGSNNDTVYFIMEFLEGEALASRLRRTGLSLPETLHVMEQCCSALAASHAKGIVHRDLKPDNIYLCPRGSDKNFVKLLDFGIAKLTGDGGMGQSQKTRTGLVIGTPAYMSPEQCEGKGQIDHRSDVYSIGVVMYELLTGRVPFPGEGFGEILVAHLTKTPDPPSALNPDVKPEIEALVLHAIEKDRNRRFQNMQEFVDALRDPAGHMQAYRPLPGYTPSNTGSTQMIGDSPTVVSPGGPHATGQGPRPTTLSGAAGEMQPGGGSAGKRIGLIAAVVVVVVGGGLGAFFGLRKSGPDTGVATNEPTKPDKPVSENLRISVSSDPPGASVMRGDTGALEPGKTPLSFTVKRGAQTFDIQVKLTGHKPTTRTISTDSDKDQAILVALEKIEEAPKPVAVVEPAKPETPKPDKPVKPDKIDKPHRERGERKASNKTEGGGGGDDMKLLQPKF